MFGYKFKVITGYESTPKIHPAMERGEINGNRATNWSTLKALNASWIEERKVKVLAQWALKKHPRRRLDFSTGKCLSAGAPRAG